MTRALAATALAVVLLAACSTTSGPPHAGTLIVNVVFVSGPSGPGINPPQDPIAHTRVSVRAANGAETTVTTDDLGNARFVVAPGIYVARLTDVIGFEGTGGTLDCGGGAPPTTARVSAADTVRVSLPCSGVG